MRRPRRVQRRGGGKRKRTGPVFRSRPPSNHVRVSKTKNALIKAAGCTNVYVYYSEVPFIPQTLDRRLDQVLRVCESHERFDNNLLTDPAVRELVRHAAGRRRLTTERERILWTEVTMRYSDSGL